MGRSQAVRLSSILAFLSLLLAPPSRADHHETWIEVRSPHFTVLSNAGEHEGRLTARQFEEIRAMFEQRYPETSCGWGKAHGDLRAEE